MVCQISLRLLSTKTLVPFRIFSTPDKHFSARTFVTRAVQAFPSFQCFQSVSQHRDVSSNRRHTTGAMAFHQGIRGYHPDERSHDEAVQIVQQRQSVAYENPERFRTVD